MTILGRNLKVFFLIDNIPFCPMSCYKKLRLLFFEIKTARLRFFARHNKIANFLKRSQFG
jgi:hypothetical protein